MKGLTRRSGDAVKSLKWIDLYGKGYALGLSKGQIWRCHTLEELQSLAAVAFKKRVKVHHPDVAPSQQRKTVRKRTSPAMCKTNESAARYTYKGGEYITVCEAAALSGLKPSTIDSRLRLGYSMVEAVNLPLNFRARKSQAMLSRIYESKRFFELLSGLPPRSTEVYGFRLSDATLLTVERW